MRLCAGLNDFRISLQFAKTVSHNDLLVSMMNLMGVPATTFGNPAYCTGPLASL